MSDSEDEVRDVDKIVDQDDDMFLVQRADHPVTGKRYPEKWVHWYNVRPKHLISDWYRLFDHPVPAGPDSSSEDEFKNKSDGEVVSGKVNHTPNQSSSNATQVRASKPPKTPRKAAVKKLPNIASIFELAEADEAVGDAAERVAGVEAGVIERIKKALALANHDGTGDAEAKVALKIASRLMAQVNVTQADLIAVETKEQHEKRAGASKVKILSTTGARVLQQPWVDSCSSAVTEAFDVKAYTSSHDGGRYRSWTFYGIAPNTVAAALAFEMVHNLILEWSLRNQTLKGRVGYKSYREGAARGLYEAVQEERAREKLKVVREEQKRIKDSDAKAKAQKAAEIARLAQPKQEDVKPDIKPVIENVSEEEDVKPVLPQVSDGPEAFFESHDDSKAWIATEAARMEGHGDDDEDDEDDEDDVQSEDDRCDDADKYDSRAYPERGASDSPDVKGEDDPTAGWNSSAQLTLFRDTAMAIAESYLASEGVKLGKARKRQQGQTDWSAYRQGTRDGKTIDLKRRRIEDV